ncbi:single stranded DNA-binding domain-containing protein [Paenibacillus pini]|uniref:Uncharacterized protein n=1 Tax=Paenibacillus pini JCM 16418 TaxID=1236976 RepID=W7YQH7_9BACL|nr:hypothetical protein [Paenibacillus pini]GAF10802.1 hypothetical protein JCM16418_5024 [Paenibacillus pini JCM 16418]
MKNNLKVTYGNFVLKGIVGGTKSEKFYGEGSSNGNDWRQLNFSVKINDNASVFVKMMGSKNDKVKVVDASDKKNKKEYYVSWADRYKERKDKSDIFMAAKVGLEKDETGKKNKIHSLTQFDAVKYIKDTVKDGDSVYIRGSLNYSVYEGKGQIKYYIQQIYHTEEDVDFKADGFEPEASFNQEIVYLDSDYDNETNKTAINTMVIYKDKTGIHPMPYVFIVNHEKYKNDIVKTAALKELTENFDRLSYGSTIKVNGNINIYAEKVTIDVNDDDVIPDFGGFQAKGQETFVKGATVREMEITGGDGSSLIVERYQEEDFITSSDPFNESEGERESSKKNSQDPFSDD